MQLVKETVRVRAGGPVMQERHAMRPRAVRDDASASEFSFVSAVDGHHRGDVESLFFFHPHQPGLIDPIRRCVDAWGTPEILQRGERISLGIPQHDAQCLFACHPRRHAQRPVGVVLYLRTQPDVLTLLHLVVSPAYTRDGTYGELELARHLVDEVRQLARRVSGVRRIQLPYCEGRFLPVKMHQRA